MSELKACAHCGHEAVPIRYEFRNADAQDLVYCQNDDCPMHHRTLLIEDWQNRPIEDALNKRIAELEGVIKADNERLIRAGLTVGLYSGCDTAETMAEVILASRARIAELEAERDEAQKMYERLMNTAFYYETILPNGNLGVNVLEVCEGLQEAHEEIVRLYRWVERLIEAGHAMSNVAEWRYTNLTELMAWDNLVAEWKEREK